MLLIIEDDLTFARIMMQIGATTRASRSSSRPAATPAWRSANEYRPDAITLDIQLPGLDGWTVLDRLKRNPTHPAHPGARHLDRRA